MSQHQLTALDWSWIVGFLLVALGLSIYHARKSSQSIENYFVAGKNTPWWILGTSIVATTFAADTPLVIAGLVISQGIAGNWIWWSVVPSGMLGVFFFAKLWRRSGCLTQAEFAIIRYGPARAKTLRLFYAFYHGLIRNAVTLGFVNLAMAKIITLCTPLDKWHALAVCFSLTVIYTTLGGINGVMWTDFLQFFLALASSIAVAICAILKVGGLSTLGEFAATGGKTSFFGESWLGGYFPIANTEAWWSFMIFATLYWIACTPTDCNGYAVQRLLCAKDEKHAIGGYLWFNFSHYVLRPWPWILVGLAAMYLYHDQYGGPIDYDEPPDFDKEYVRVILESAPAWLIGPALASLLAAYMSTVDTHLNWSASYLINDCYRPYIKPGRSDKHYVQASRLATIFIALAGIGMTFLMNSIIGGWELIAVLLAGMGVVGILRWMWWRVTAWTEVGCMIGAGLSSACLYPFAEQIEFPFTLLIIVPVSLLGAAIGTFAFAPEPREVLLAFVRKVRPPGPGWNAVQSTAAADPPARASEPVKSTSFWRQTICWALGTAAVYCAMFGIGDLLLKSKARGLCLCMSALLLAIVVGKFYRSDSSADDSHAQRAL